MIQVALLILGLVPVACIVAALVRRLWVTAFLMLLGTGAGVYLAIVPLSNSMARYEAETGYGAGNAGVLFCCTIPTFPAIGLLLGGLIGFAIDARFMPDDEAEENESSA